MKLTAVISTTVLLTLPLHSATLKEIELREARLAQKEKELAAERSALDKARAKLGIPTPASGKSLTAPDITSTEALESEKPQRWILRQSVFNVTTGRVDDSIKKPAEINYTRKGSGDETFAVDAGVAYRINADDMDFFSDVTSELWIGADYHRKTLAPLKETFQAGLGSDHVIGDITSWPVVLNTTLDVFYKNDTVADNRSINGGLLFNPIIPALGTNIWHGEFDSARWARFRYAPYFGFLYDHEVDTNNNVSRGHQLLFKYGIELGVFLFPARFGESIEFQTSYTRWEVLDGNGALRVDPGDGWFSASLIFNLTEAFMRREGSPPPKFQMGIQVSYENGDNPETGTVDEDLLTLGFTAKY